MKQDMTEYMVDSFVDFNGVERKIVACALSQSPETGDDGFDMCIGWADLNGRIDIEDADFAKVYRIVTVGIAICNPTDTYDEEAGKKAAYNKALHDPKCPSFYTTIKGVASKTLVEAFLKQEIAYTKENPERIIKGYNQNKERFDKRERVKNKLKSLNANERMIVNLYNQGLDVLEYVALAKKAKQLGLKLDEYGI